MRHNRWYLLVVSTFLAFSAYAQNAPGAPAADAPQTSAQAPQPAPAAAPSPSAWTRKGFDFYLLGDVYYDVNFNHPDSGYNQLYNFDVRANQAHLNMAKLSIEHAPAPVGFRLDLGVGNAFDIVGASDHGPDWMKYIEQAYVDFKPAHAHGLQLDFGKFVTSAGAEVIETNANWNYSRSLLFAWAIPYYHTGLRATIPVTKTFTAGVQLVEGWNQVRDNNSGKTLGLVGTFAFKKVTWSNTYYTGPEHDHDNKGFRQLYDTVVTINQTDKLSYYLNFDIGTDKDIALGRQNWTGFAAAARYQLTPRFAISPRAEIFDDIDGFSTGVKQRVKEITMTGEMKLCPGVFSRLEFRRDNSNVPFFDRGGNPGSARAQTTVALGLVAFFGPKR